MTVQRAAILGVWAVLAGNAAVAGAQQDAWPAQIAREIEAQEANHADELRACRGHLRGARPPELRVAMRVGADGGVVAAWVVSMQNGDERVGRCVVRIVEQWQLLAHPGPRPRVVTQTIALPLASRAVSPLVGQQRRIPVVRMGSPTVGPSYSPEIVRRVVRRSFNQVRYCYERQLAYTPQLAGRIEVAFTIKEDGRVGDVSIASSTLAASATSAAASQVELCVRHMFARWTFPAPTAGTLNVRYPLIFQPGP